MINLIPENAKSRVRREYLARTGAVWLFLFATALTASAIFLMPTYVLYIRQSGDLHTDKTEPEGRAEEYARITASLEEAAVFAQQLSQKDASITASEILTHVERARNEGVTLLGLYAAREKEKVKIEVRGAARSRESLRTFQDALRRDAFFLDAQVPVSDLARDTDLTFTMTLTLRTTTTP